MIKYKMGNWGVHFVFRLRGSVFPKATVVGLIGMVLTVLLHFYARQEMADDDNPFQLAGFDMVWAGYTSVLSFLLVFRNNQAYTRFWEGASLVNQIRGEWFNSISSLFAFSNQAPEFAPRVQEFQHNLVRLASLLYCSALQQICELGDDCFDVLDYEGMSEESISFMKMSNDRCEVIVQWMQRLMVDAHEVNILKIPAPLLTRAFQELSRGIVNLNNARKIQEIPFPFPYAQLITCMLLVHGLATPVIASQNITSVAVAAASTFLLTFVLWCLVFTTMEIDQPFGDDPNDLPLHDMQRDFNESLITLMHPLAQKVPEYRRLDTVSDKASASTATRPLRMSMTTALDTLGVMDVTTVRTKSMAGLARRLSVSSPSLRRPTMHSSHSELRHSETVDPDSPSSRRRSWEEAVAWASESQGHAGGLNDDCEAPRAADSQHSEQGAAAPGPAAQHLGSGDTMAARVPSVSAPSRKRIGSGGGAVRSAGAAEDQPNVGGSMMSPTQSSAFKMSPIHSESPLPAEDPPRADGAMMSPTQSSRSMMSQIQSEAHPRVGDRICDGSNEARRVVL